MQIQSKKSKTNTFTPSLSNNYIGLALAEEMIEALKGNPFSSLRVLAGVGEAIVSNFLIPLKEEKQLNFPN